MLNTNFIFLAEDLETAGLLWRPEIGDEISDRTEPESVSVLVDPQGMSPTELRQYYLWLPSVEQMVLQLEVRQAVLFHAGLELSDVSMAYKTVIQTAGGQIETMGKSLRLALGEALHGLLIGSMGPADLH